MQSRREFLIGTGTVLALPRNLALLADVALTPRERRLLQNVLEDYPELSPETALAMLREGGA